MPSALLASCRLGALVAFSAPLLLLALLSAVPPAAGSALTTTINANERSCFYAAVDKVGEKVRVPLALPR